MKPQPEGNSEERGVKGWPFRDLGMHAAGCLWPVETVFHAEQAVATRRLLQSSSDTAAVVQVQMTGANENATAAIAQELGSVVANSALQVGSFCLPVSGIGDAEAPPTKVARLSLSSDSVGLMKLVACMSR